MRARRYAAAEAAAARFAHVLIGVVGHRACLVPLTYPKGISLHFFNSGGEGAALGAAASAKADAYRIAGKALNCKCHTWAMGYGWGSSNQQAVAVGK